MQQSAAVYSCGESAVSFVAINALSASAFAFGGQGTLGEPRSAPKPQRKRADGELSDKLRRWIRLEAARHPKPPGAIAHDAAGVARFGEMRASSTPSVRPVLNAW
jgi:hypothetical protein